MERDSRRDRGQWRGCHTFKDIICDGNQPATARRDGGLKMGQPYYYYYELDGSRETHDPTRPSTSACPYMPGQTVNVMVVPAEKSDRQRSASLSSVHSEDFMTMEPDDKFLTPRPAPVLPALPEFLGPRHRLPTAQPPYLKHKRSDRSLSPSPAPSWWSPKKLFARKRASTSSQASADETSVSISSWSEEQRSNAAPSSAESTQTRSMSPESLRRFLMDEAPVSPEVEATERLKLSIPDDIAEEEDDDFVVASAISEFGPKTILSPPPPISRNPSSDSTSRRPSAAGLSISLRRRATQTRLSAASRGPLPSDASCQEPTQQPENVVDVPASRFSLSSDDGSLFDDDADSISPATDNEIPSFYHSDAEEDDTDADGLSPPPRQPVCTESIEETLTRAFEGYHLPRTSMDGQSKSASSSQDGAEGSVSVVSSPPLLALPVIDDFVSELKSAGLSF